MKKQTIEIEVPDGKKAVWKDGNIIFEDIKHQLPNTWEEFCKQNRITKNEAYINNSCIILPLGGENPRCAEGDRNVLPNTKAAEQHLALMQLHQLIDCYRQGWVPDWGVKTDWKHFIAKNVEGKETSFMISCTSDVPRFLSFETRKIAEEFLTNFRDLIEQAGDLI